MAAERTVRNTVKCGVALALVAVAVVVLVAPAMGAFGVLRLFGPTGSGPGRISPHAAGIAVAADGRVYVADRKDSRIEAFTNDGAPDGSWTVASPAGVAVAPDDSVVVSGPGGVRRYGEEGALINKLSDDGGLTGVAVGADGGVWAADPLHGRVLGLGTDVVIGGMAEPVAVAVAPDGTVFVADAGAGRVRAFAPDGTPVRSWSAPDPRGIAVTPGGLVLVVDGSGGRVRVYDQQGEGAGSFGASLNVPHAVATDCRGSAYVVDNSAKRIAVFGDEGAAPPCPAPVEPTPTATPTPTASPTPPPEIAVLPEVVVDEDPILGVRGRVTPVSGTVLVARKGQGYRKLDGATLLPVGSSIDATAGHVKLEFEAAPADRPAYGRFMTGEFYDGSFTIEQGTNSSLVDLVLLDEGSPGKRFARASAKKGLKVWGKAKGRFRTKGRNGAATVRGTQWLTQEKAEGTYFAVTEGLVAVKDFRTGRTHLLRAGDSYLARPTCVSRRAFRIRLRVPPGAKVRSASVRVAGKRVAVRYGKRVTAPIDLRGMPQGKVTVRITIRTQDGRTVSGKRIYDTCAGKQQGGVPKV